MEDTQPNPPRKTRVGRIYYSRNGELKAVPFIRLSGKWVEKIGFKVGDTIAISLENGKITLTGRSATKPLPPDQGELF